MALQAWKKNHPNKEPPPYLVPSSMRKPFTKKMEQYAENIVPIKTKNEQGEPDIPFNMVTPIHANYIKRMTLSTRFKLQRCFENPTQYYRVDNPEELFCPFVLDPKLGAVTRTIPNEHFEVSNFTREAVFDHTQNRSPRPDLSYIHVDTPIGRYLPFK